MLRYSLVLAAALSAASTAGAGSWAEGLFDSLSKDFGSVPRGPLLTHDFRVKNNTKNTVTISSLRVSCGCVTAVARGNTLKPGESTTVHATMDTTRFIGPKSVTVFVQFSEPQFDEVRLTVQANGRTDFTLSPEGLRFGSVKRGTAPTATVTLTFYGYPAAKITQVKGESTYVQPTFKEAKRTEFEVSYTVTAKLRDTTPVGRWFTDVWVKTDVAGLAQVRVPLTVDVESPLTVSPAVVSLGAVKVKEGADRRVIIRGVTAFKITDVKGLAGDIEVKKSAESREVHVLTLKVKPGKAGTIDRTLRVITDMKKDNEIDFKVSGTVTAD
jgi:hypothetical protein